MRKLRILIVDDDDTSAQLLQIITEDYSEETIIVNNGLDCVNAVTDNPNIDLIFLDIGIPILNGSECIEKIRKFNKNIVIFVSSGSDLGRGMELVDNGANEYIQKPVSISRIHKLINEYFN